MTRKEKTVYEKTLKKVLVLAQKESANGAMLKFRRSSTPYEPCNSATTRLRATTYRLCREFAVQAGIPGFGMYSESTNAMAGRVLDSIIKEFHIPFID
jgi:hypothetical protein